MNILTSISLIFSKVIYMKTKLSLFLTILAVVMSFSSTADNKLRYETSVQTLPDSIGAGPIAPELVTVNAANLVGRTIVSMTYDGVEIPNDAVLRLQALLESGSEALINTKIAPNGASGLYLGTVTNSAWYTKERSYDVPATIPFEIPIHVQVQMSTYPSDNDASRFIINAVNIDDTWVRVINTGFRNWPYSGQWLRETTTLSTEVKSLDFYGTCQRYGGKNCDGWIRGPAVTFNPDLPPVGAEVEVIFQ